MSAAIYMKRANLNILLITKGYGALEKAGKIENYYGVKFYLPNFMQKELYLQQEKIELYLI